MEKGLAPMEHQRDWLRPWSLHAYRVGHMPSQPSWRVSWCCCSVCFNKSSSSYSASSSMGLKILPILFNNNSRSSDFPWLYSTRSSFNIHIISNRSWSLANGDWDSSYSNWASTRLMAPVESSCL
jgi:hypothetical protein